MLRKSLCLHLQCLLLVPSSTTVKIQKLRHKARSKFTGALSSCTHIFRRFFYTIIHPICRKVVVAFGVLLDVSVLWKSHSKCDRLNYLHFSLSPWRTRIRTHGKQIRELLQLAISSWAAHHLVNTVNYHVLCYSFGELRVSTRIPNYQSGQQLHWSTK